MDPAFGAVSYGRTPGAEEVLKKSGLAGKDSLSG